jgi:GNAT superfamily N-acetyltransferase
LRAARPEDAETIHLMMKALAEYMGHGEKFTSTVEDVRRDGFGRRPLYEALLAELDGQPAGIAVYFSTYSTFNGRPCLFIDSLYIEDEARGYDLGRRLMATVCARAVARGCCRVDLHVLHTNAARGFYENIGMRLTEELPYEITGRALQDLAALG